MCKIETYCFRLIEFRCICFLRMCALLAVAVAKWILIKCYEITPR